MSSEVGLIATATGSGIEPIPEGVYTAVCYGVIDAGHQYSEKYDKVSHKVVLIWEIPELRIEVERDGKPVNLPRVISKRYTLSLGDKAVLRKDLEAWRGRAFTEPELKRFEMQRLLGAACQLQVIHTRKDAKIYANAGALMALPKGVKAPTLESDTLFFSFEAAGANPVIPAGVPEWIVKLIKESKEWEKLTIKQAKVEPTSPAVTTPALPSDGQPAGEDDDVPF
jgi:hypothetical protein